MKNFNWLLTLLLSVIGFAFPEFSDVNEVSLAFSSLAGFVGLVVICVNGLKNALNYNDDSWKHLPKVFSVIVAVLLAHVGWWLNIGLFTAQIIVWWQVIAFGFIAAGASMLWYDVTFGNMILQLLGFKVKK